MFTYKQFFSHLLTEMYYGQTHKFEDLPENRPYGFMVYPDGTFGIAGTSMSHDLLVGGAQNISKIIKLGGVRVVISGDELYLGEYIRGRVKPAAMKTARDLATWYNMDLDFEESDLAQLYQV